MFEGAGVPTGTPLSDPALIEMISEDPILRGTHLIAEAWDAAGLYQVSLGQWLLTHGLLLSCLPVDPGHRMSDCKSD